MLIVFCFICLPHGICHDLAFLGCLCGTRWASKVISRAWWLSYQILPARCFLAKETSFRQWIGGIDPAVNTDSRAETIDGLIKFLAEIDIQCPSDLDDMEYPKDFTGTVKGGKVALLYKILK